MKLNNIIQHEYISKVLRNIHYTASQRLTHAATQKKSPPQPNRRILGPPESPSEDQRNQHSASESNASPFKSDDILESLSIIRMRYLRSLN
jgi:hypothetical protein